MRYAVLHHDHPFEHWDLLLETPQLCWTWRLLDPPDTAGIIRAERIADHRAWYLTYRGAVSGNRGTVTPWDTGRFIWLTATETRVVGLVTGIRWQGGIELLADSAGTWTLRLISPPES